MSGSLIGWRRYLRGVRVLRALDPLRDEVMRQASRESEGCSSLAFEGVPDSWRGAYVFRNGLPEALRRSAPAVGARLESIAKAECRITLRSERFASYAVVGSE